MDINYGLIICNCISYGLDIFLPNPSDCKITDVNGNNISKIFTIKKSDISVNAVNIIPYSSELIDGLSSYSLTTLNEKITLQTEGINWYII